MANRRISEFPAISGGDINDQDLLTLVHVFEVDPTLRNKKITFAQFKEYLNTYYAPTSGTTFSGNVSISGNLTVAGLSSFNSITASGSSTFSGIIVQNDATVSGTVSGLTVTGTNVQGTNVNAVNATVVTATGTTSAFTSGVYQNLSGATITGGIVNSTSGVFNDLSGVTITGTTVAATTGTFQVLGTPILDVGGNLSVASGLTVTGLAQFSSGVQVTGTLSGTTVTGSTARFTSVTGVSGVFTTQLSGATITGDTVRTSNITGISGTFTSRVSGATVTGNTGSFGNVSGISGVFTEVLSGALITGDTGRYTTFTGVSGTFTRVSGSTVTGNTVAATIVSGVSGVFNSFLSATTITGASGIFTDLTSTSGTFTTQVSGATVTGNIGQFTLLTGAAGTFTTSVSGLLVTGNTGNFTNLTGIAGVFTTSVSGATITGNTIQGTSGIFTYLSGTTFTGTTVNASTGVFQTLAALNLAFINTVVSGNFSVLGSSTFTSGVQVTGTLSGTTITGTTVNATSGNFVSLSATSGGFTTATGVTASFTSGSFISLTGTTVSGTTANFVSGTFSTSVSGATVTGDVGAFTSITGGLATFTSGVFASGSVLSPSISFVGDSDTGFYTASGNYVSITTSGTERFTIDSTDGNPIIDNQFPVTRPSLDLNFAGTRQLDSRITFSRSSTGTYFDSTGTLQSAATNEARFDHGPTTGESLGLLVEEARTNGQTNSERFDNSTWGKGNGVIVLPESGLAPDNTWTAEKLIPVNGNRFTALSGSASYVNGTTYSFSVFVKKAGARYAAVAFGGGNQAVSGLTIDLDTGVGTVFVRSGYIPILSSGVQALPNGWYRIHAVATRGNFWDDQIRIYASTSNIDGGTVDIITGDGSSGVLIWGAQLEAGSFPTSYIPTPATFTSRSTTATYYDASGTIQTAGINVARDAAYLPDENGVMRPAGLLLEAAGTNLITHSEDFNTWIKNGLTGVTTNTTAAPDGTITADKLVENASNGRHETYRQSIPNTPAGTYTFSVFAKAAERSVLQLVLNSTGNPGANFNLSSGIVSLENNATGKIEKLDNGWYKCSVTGSNSNSTLAAVYCSMKVDDQSAMYETYLGDGTSGLFLWGAQLEASSYPTSYIPTTSSTVTRAADVSSSSTVTRSADVAQITGTNFSSWYNQSEGTAFCNFVPQRGNTTEAWAAQFGSTTLVGPNSFVIGKVSNNLAYAETRVNSVTQYSASLSVPTGAMRVAYGVKNLDHRAAFNGQLAAASAVSFAPLSSDSLYIGRNVASTQLLGGTISRLTYYPVRLPDATLQTLTS